MKRASLLLLAIIVLGGASVAFSAPSSSGATQTRRLGFWIDERDIWSGVGLCWSASQFVQDYFETSPYPSAMLFATGLQPSGACSPGATGEATWLSQVASDAQAAGLNVEIVILMFVNLSGQTVNGIADQTAALQSFMSALGSHSNIYGAEYEIEYYGNTAAEEQLFYNTIHGAGYVDILNPGTSVSGVSGPSLGYSTYPYFGGTIPTGLPSGSNCLGVGYGETGAPSGSTPNPAWTQTSVQAIVDSSPANPFVLMYAGAGGTGQPSWQLWNWSTLRQWVWSDSSYQQNFILSTNSPVTTTSSSSTTSTTSTSTKSSTTSTTSTTTSTSKTSSSTSVTSSVTTTSSTSPSMTTVTKTVTVTQSGQATTTTITVTTTVTTTMTVVTSAASQQAATVSQSTGTTTSQTTQGAVTSTTSSPTTSQSATSKAAQSANVPDSQVFTRFTTLGLVLASGGALALVSIKLLDSRGLITRSESTNSRGKGRKNDLAD